MCKYLQMIYQYIIPANEYLAELFDYSSKAYLKWQMDLFTIMFVIFMLLLLVSLVFVMQVVMNKLRKMVFRSRILLKIIPSSELKRIIMNKTLLMK